MNHPTIDYLIDQKFPYIEMRKGQRDIISDIISSYMSGKKHYILEAGTGTGKSVILYTASKVIAHIQKWKDVGVNDLSRMVDPVINPDSDGKADTLILTKTKALQDQYETSFTDLKTIKSSVNYHCGYHNSTGVRFNSDQCINSYGKCTSSCGYVTARSKINLATVRCTNYAFFMSAIESFSRMIKSSVLVCDEAHLLEDSILSSYSFELKPRRLATFINSIPHTDKTTEEAVIKRMVKLSPDDKQLLEYFTSILLESIDHIMYLDDNSRYMKLIAKRMVTLKFEINLPTAEAYDIPDYECEENGISFNTVKSVKETLGETPTLKEVLTEIRKNNRMASTYSLLENITTNIAHSTAVTDVNQETGVFTMKSIQVSESMVRFHSQYDFIIYASATICGENYFRQSVLIDDDESSYLDVGSAFPSENHSIISVGLTPMNYTNKDVVLKEYLETLDMIIEGYDSKECGIIHTSSYTNARLIKSNSKYGDRIFIPESGVVYNYYELMRDTPGLIIASPAILEGVDIHSNVGSYQIFFKVPFISLGSKYVQAKRVTVPGWYSRETVISMVQGAGRCVRSETDVCQTYILDGTFERLYMQNREMFPKLFKDCMID